MHKPSTIDNNVYLQPPPLPYPTTPTPLPPLLPIILLSPPQPIHRRPRHVHQLITLCLQQVAGHLQLLLPLPHPLHQQPSQPLHLHWPILKLPILFFILIQHLFSLCRAAALHDLL